MKDYLFKAGQVVVVPSKGKTIDLLIIGSRVTDENGVQHDYAGVPFPEGYNGKICCFEHREIIDIE